MVSGTSSIILLHLPVNPSELMQCNINIITFLSFPCHSLWFSLALLDSLWSLELGLWLVFLPDVFFCDYTIEQFWYLNITSLSEAWLNKLNIRQGSVSLPTWQMDSYYQQKVSSLETLNFHFIYSCHLWILIYLFSLLFKGLV